MTRLLLVLSFSLSLVLAKAQDSCGLRISLLTCSPGEELYSTFGHTAIRVQNLSAGTDVVYNYGTFDFDDPGFYLKFVRGKLLYFVSTEPFEGQWGFREAYRYENRSIREQEVLLSCAQKGELLKALQTNALPQNRQYKYDFIRDNCTTRAADMIEGAAGGRVQRALVIPADSTKAPSFRNLIHEYLDRGQHYWSKLGIDLLLGARLDRKANNRQAQFLPEKLLAGMEGARVNEAPLVAPAQPILNNIPVKPEFALTPGMIFGTLLVLIAILSFVPWKPVSGFLRFFDFVLFFLTGLVGVLLLFMWFGTDHYWCANNWNLLWALPTHLMAAPFLRRAWRWVNWYLLFTIVTGAATVLLWLFLPQQLNVGFLPLVLLLVLRAWLIILKPHHNANDPLPEPEPHVHH